MLWHKSQGAGGASVPVSTWDLATLTYVPPASTVFEGLGLFFKPDGLSAYTSDVVLDVINQYTLTSAWDISTAAFTQSFSVSAENAVPRNLYFKPDGLKMYVSRGTSTGGEIIQYDLGTAWDISTASLVFKFLASAQHPRPAYICFRDDGLKMYVQPYSNNPPIYEYDLSTAWDISTAAFLQSATVGLNVVGQSRHFYIRPDGLRIFITDSFGAVFAFDLSTAWDITTASGSESSAYFYFNDSGTGADSAFFSSDGFKYYVIRSNTVYAWDMS